jgi:hypothetical protein
MGFDVQSTTEVRQVIDEMRRQRPELAHWRFTLENAQPAGVELVATTDDGKGSFRMTVPLDGTANSADIERAVVALSETAPVAINEEGPVSTPWLRT